MSVDYGTVFLHTLVFHKHLDPPQEADTNSDTSVSEADTGPNSDTSISELHIVRQPPCHIIESEKWDRWSRVQPQSYL